MSKDEIIEKYWVEFLVWNVNYQANQAVKDYTRTFFDEPNEVNFWKWFMTHKYTHHKGNEMVATDSHNVTEAANPPSHPRGSES